MTPSSTSYRTIHVHVQGMMCQRNCGTTVTNALKAIPGVQYAEASFAQQRAVAVLPDATPEEVVVDAIEDVGFDAIPVQVVQLHVVGMMCQKNCGTTVENALRMGLQTKELQHVFVSFAQQRACVLFDGRVLQEMNCTIEELQKEAVEIVENVGFDATVIQDEFPLEPDEADASSTTATRTTQAANSTPLHVRDNEVAFQVSGMSCAVCTGRVERALQDSHADITNVTVVLATARAVVEFDSHADRNDVTEACLESVRAAGYPCEILQTSLQENAAQLERARIEELETWKKLLFWSLTLTVPLFLITKGYIFIPAPCSKWIQFLLSTVVQFGVGKRFYKAAWKGWTNGRVMGMDFLIVMGTTASYIYSVSNFLAEFFYGSSMKSDASFLTSAMLLSFVTLGKYLESFAKGKTASALQTLMELQPLFASRVILPKGQEMLDPNVDISSLRVEEVNVSQIQVGDYLRVLPGSRVPTDGKLVTASHSSSSKMKSSTAQVFVDESALSGEPFPVAKTVGDSVYGSTVNQLSVLVMKVTATGGETALSKIVRLMEDAQRQKAPIQAYADSVASVFAPAVMLLSGLTLFAWLVFDTGENRWVDALMTAISVIVVACPCALGLATPTAVMVGTGVGAKQGLLIKGGAVLENMHSVDTVIFDKTGTLSTGRAVLGERIEYVEAGDELLEGIPSKVPASHVCLWLAACAEAQSEHPLAKAVVNAATSVWGGDVTCSTEHVRVNDFQVVPGRGVECLVVKDGWGSWWVRVGSRQWTKEITSPAASIDSNLTGDDEVAQLRKRGHIAIYVSVLPANQTHVQRRIIGVLGIVDPIKKDASSTVRALRNMGIDCWMCTGDHELTANAVASQIGIESSNVCAGVSPEGKADLVSRLKKRSRGTGASDAHKIAVVGDGINDAVALARSDVGIAIGTGTEVAVEAADVVLVRSSLHDVVVAIHLSKVVFRRIMMNFGWATGYNILALPVAAGVLAPFTNFHLRPEMAGLMMAFSSVSVVTSSLLLRNYTRPTIGEDGLVSGGEGIVSRSVSVLSCVFARIAGNARGQQEPFYENVPLTRLDLEIV